jgi:hypothetical protein
MPGDACSSGAKPSLWADHVERRSVAFRVIVGR